MLASSTVKRSNVYGSITSHIKISRYLCTTITRKKKAFTSPSVTAELSCDEILIPVIVCMIFYIYISRAIMMNNSIFVCFIADANVLLGVLNIDIFFTDKVIVII